MTTVLKRITEVLSKEEDVNLSVLKMKEISYLTDYFVILTANSSTHMKALRDRVIEIFKESGQTIIYHDRNDDHDWMIVDAGDIVVHIFTPSAREFYDLEALWTDADVVSAEEEEES